MEKEGINKRFITAVQYLLDNKLAGSKKEVADMLNLKQSTFSEILNKRSSVSAETIARLAYQYNVSIDFIFKGEGLILLGNRKDQLTGRGAIEIEAEHLKEMEYKNKEIEGMQKEIELLREMLDLLKQSRGNRSEMGGEIKKVG